jgi:hypothetical protein
MIEHSLEGPFSAEELDELRRRGLIKRDAKIRRRGDSTWQNLESIAGGLETDA